MGRRGVLAVLVSLAVGAVTACGDGDTAVLGRRAFTASVNTECRRLQRAGDELRALSDPSVTGEAVTRGLERAAGILRKRLRAIDGLVPPETLADGVARMISTLERYADRLADLGRRAEAGQTFAALQQEHRSLVQQLNDLTNAANLLAGSLRLDECIAGTA